MRSFSRPPWWLALLVVFFHFGGLVGRAWAEEEAQNRASAVARAVRFQAGGWGIATPLLVAGVATYQHIRGEDEFEAKDLLNRRLLGGLAGDFATVAIFRMIAPALPFGPLVQSLFVTFGGFLGWEIGSGNLAHADWTSIALQSSVATLVSVGLPMLGLSIGALPAGLLGMAAAISAGILYEYFRDQGPIHEYERRSESLTLSDPEVEDEPPAPSISIAPKTVSRSFRTPEQDRAYRDLVEASKLGGEPFRQAFDAYKKVAGPDSPE